MSNDLELNDDPEKAGGLRVVNQLEGTTNVFLDANVFIEENFSYTSPRFKALEQLAVDGRIKVILTEITQREIEANLWERVKSAAIKLPPVLRNSESPKVAALFEPIDKASIHAELLQQLGKFLQRAKVEILPIGKASLGPVFESYFGRLAPFGPGKNKAEFPDAFALSALEEWCKLREESIAVVSRDKGVRDACSTDRPFLNFKDLAQYLNAIASEDEEVTSFVWEQLPKHEEVILQRVKEELPKIGWILRDQEGDVDDVEVVDVDDVEGLGIFSLSPFGATLDVSVEISLVAEICYYDPASGVYDGESGVLMFQDTVRERVARKVYHDVNVEVSFENLDPTSFGVVSVWLEGDIEIESDYDEEWPYK